MLTVGEGMRQRRGLIKGLRYRLVYFSGDLHEENVFPALTVCTLKTVRMCLWKSVSLNVSLYTTVPEHDRQQQQKILMTFLS